MDRELVSFSPNEELINTLMSLGISRNAAIRALYNTGNDNADNAAAWAFENQHENLDFPVTSETLSRSSSDEENELINFPNEDLYKMVIVVNSSLSMGVGKVAAQAAHGAVGLFKELMQQQQEYGEMLLTWDDYGSRKIVLKGQNAEELLELDKKAKSLNLSTYLVYDAGRTQVQAGSLTVLAILGKTLLIDQVTGNLSLL